MIVSLDEEGGANSALLILETRRRKCCLGRLSCRERHGTASAVTGGKAGHFFLDTEEEKKRDGKDLRFQFEDLEEMKTAVSGLQALLGERLRLKVRWDDRKGEYVKAA